MEKDHTPKYTQEMSVGSTLRESLTLLFTQRSQPSNIVKAPMDWNRLSIIRTLNL